MRCLALAKLVDSLPNLKLRGLLSYDGGAQHVIGFHARKERALRNIEENARTCEKMKAAGLNTEIFSGGGTGTYSMQHLVPGFTDVQVGSYVFMDMQYLAVGSEDGHPVYNDFEPSLTVLATILNNRFAGRLTTDAGAKALTLNTPRAGDRRAGNGLQRRLDESATITFKEASKSYKMGDSAGADRAALRSGREPVRLRLRVRKDRVESVWEINARGHSQ